MTNDPPDDGSDTTLREFASGQKLFRRYTLKRTLGRGGMGIVWLAHDDELELEVALKFLPDPIIRDHAMLSDLKRETRRSLELTHKNIVRIYDFIHDETSGCISMEYIDGDTLSNLRADKPHKIFEPAELTDWMSQLCDALNYAHNHARIIHRDLKPTNLMVNQRGDLKISDFGIARNLSDSVSKLTMQPGKSGTLVYMSPQQLDGERGNHLDDIYSLGASIYELLTSKPPFYSGNVDRQIREKIPSTMTQRRKELGVEGDPIDAAWEEVVQACLAKNPNRRPQSVAEIAKRLKVPSPKTRHARRAAAKASKRTGILAAIALLIGIAAICGWYFRFFQNFGKIRNVVTIQPSVTEPKASPKTSAPLAASDKSIAVLPFENLSRDPDNAFFADGVQDEILTNLARIADLKVISRTSVMPYKSNATRNLRAIGKALGVAHLLEGSVQRAGGKVRVNAQLIDARTDMHLWAQSYDRDLADVFAIQSEIAKTIADQLQAKISPSEKAAIEKPPTKDPIAYDLYLRAQLLYADTTDSIQAKQKLPKAARLLDKAVAHDPHFLLAWCLLSKVHSQSHFLGYDHTAARLELANVAAQEALRLQPDAGEAHLAQADYYYHGFRDYERARTELAIAQRTLPNNAQVFEYTGYIDRREGHWEEATRNLERALELDPRNFVTVQQLAIAYQQQRRYADEARTYDRALTIVLGDPATRILRAQVALDERADIKPYQTMLATLMAEDPSVAPDVDDPLYALCERTATAAARALTNYPRDGSVYNAVNYPHAYWEGVVARWQGDSAKAQAAFNVARSEVAKTVEKQPDFPAGLSLLGMIDAGLGRKEEALGEGRRACELLPISKDAFDGPAFAVNLAQIYAWTGEKDLAIEQIAAVERVPNFLSYGFLKLQPQWDSLRGDPRFEEIIASLAPKN